MRKLLFVFLLHVAVEAFAQKPQTDDVVNAGNFRASVVKVDITPDSPKMLLGYAARQSTGIHDRIYMRIVVLDDGITQFYLVQSDLCLTSPSEYDDVASILLNQLGIDPLNFWWSVTHTHSAPELGVPGLPEVFMGDRYKHIVDSAYKSLVANSMVNGIIEARHQLTPARFGVGWGVSMANMNRRAVNSEGRATGYMNPNKTADRKIGLIRLDKEDGTPLALIANYAMHGTVLGPTNTLISGDAPGIVAQYVEKKTGVPMLYINGAAGNIAPIYSVYPNAKAGHLAQFRVLLGDKILEAYNNIVDTSDSVRLFTDSLIIETPRKQNLDWPSDLRNYTRTNKSGINLVRLPVRFLNINNEVAIWSAPLELFCEISMGIRERSPYPYTFYFGYTNGWLGYLATEKEFQYGGYEINTVSPFTVSVEKDFTEPIDKFFQRQMPKTMHD